MKIIPSKLVVFGTLFSLCLAVILGHLLWKELIGKEAINYGELFVRKLHLSVKEVDKTLFKTVVAPYEQGKDLKKLMKDWEKSLKPILKTNKFFVGFYKSCSADQVNKCYFDTDPTGRDIRNYTPKSRPWYLASRSHNDWVFIHLMRLRATRRVGYPPQMGYSLSRQMKINGESIIFNIFFTEKIFAQRSSEELKQPILNLANPKYKNHFLEIDSVTSHLRFKTQQENIDVQCYKATKYGEYYINYLANVYCVTNSENIQFFIHKKYDHLFHFVILIFILLLMVTIMCFWFVKISNMQKQAIQDRIEVEKERTARTIGARLIHDLKKGLLANLNLIKQNYETDFEEELLQPDFEERLLENFKHHFKYLDFLNRYVSLLTNHMNRLPEESWIALDKKSLQEYLKWILGEKSIVFEEIFNKNLVLDLKISANNHENPTILVNPDLLGFKVPEMSFYRILKNLWDNYNAYGSGFFTLKANLENGYVHFMSTNDLKPENEIKVESTGLGLTIIKQLLEDNFGQNKSYFTFTKTETQTIIKFGFKKETKN